MKKLLLASALAVGLSFPAISQAEVNAFGVQLPLNRTEVSQDLIGGYVAQDLGDTFEVQKLNKDNAQELEVYSENENVYSVFGVNISGDQVI